MAIDYALEREANKWADEHRYDSLSLAFRAGADWVKSKRPIDFDTVEICGLTLSQIQELRNFYEAETGKEITST